jgi:ketosteroid isomerase-like protein
MTMISALPKMEEGFLAPTKHSERKKRASLGMTGGRRVLLVLALLASFAGRAEAQAVPSLESIQSQAELDKAITALDAALFDAYNRCDLEKFASFISEDVEFYHDNGGVTLGREKLTDSVKKNICGKVTRELVPGTLQVYYMKGYGAVEMGVHRFHHPGHEDTEGVGEGKFIHLWQYKDGAWKVTRVISYDHHAAAK